jgi:hypothetical protein
LGWFAPASVPTKHEQRIEKEVNTMKAITEHEDTVAMPKPIKVVFSKDLADLVDKARQPKAPTPKPQPQRREVPVSFREPYGLD